MDNPLTCPRCQTPTTATGVVICGGCGKPFALHVGPAVDPSKVPQPAGAKIQVKSPGAFLLRFGVIDERGIGEGQLDPVIGAIPVDTAGVAWHDVGSIAVWRSPAWTDLVVAALIPLPIAAFALSFAARSGAAAVIGLLFAAFAAILLWRGLGVKACRARIVGRYRTIVVRFDRPFWRRQRFHDELLRRSGNGPAAMP